MIIPAVSFLIPLILEYLFKKHKQKKSSPIDNNGNVIEKNISWFTVPFKNKLGTVIKAQKDILLKLYNRNIIYKISCKDYEVSYVGQTDRQVKMRISEYKNYIKRSTNTQSVITEHRITEGHEFDWDNISILDKERGKTLNFENVAY